jgi:hypothetical protein
VLGKISNDPPGNIVGMDENFQHRIIFLHEIKGEEIWEQFRHADTGQFQR